MEEEVKKMKEMQDILEPELPKVPTKEKSKEQKGEPKVRRKSPSASV
jgi:hypothetical protein